MAFLLCPWLGISKVLCDSVLIRLKSKRKQDDCTTKECAFTVKSGEKLALVSLSKVFLSSGRLLKSSTNHSNFTPFRSRVSVSLLCYSIFSLCSTVVQPKNNLIRRVNDVPLSKIGSVPCGWLASATAAAAPVAVQSVQKVFVQFWSCNKQGGGQCISTWGGAFQRDQKRAIPFGLIAQCHPSQGHQS